MKGPHCPKIRQFGHQNKKFVVDYHTLSMKISEPMILTKEGKRETTVTIQGRNL